MKLFKTTKIPIYEVDIHGVYDPLSWCKNNNISVALYTKMNKVNTYTRWLINSMKNSENLFSGFKKAYFTITTNDHTIIENIRYGMVDWCIIGNLIKDESASKMKNLEVYNGMIYITQAISAHRVWFLIDKEPSKFTELMIKLIECTKELPNEKFIPLYDKYLDNLEWSSPLVICGMYSINNITHITMVTPKEEAVNLSIHCRRGNVSVLDMNVFRLITLENEIQNKNTNNKELYIDSIRNALNFAFKYTGTIK